MLINNNQISKFKKRKRKLFAWHKSRRNATIPALIITHAPSPDTSFFWGEVEEKENADFAKKDQRLEQE